MSPTVMGGAQGSSGVSPPPKIGDHPPSRPPYVYIYLQFGGPCSVCPPSPSSSPGCDWSHVAEPGLGGEATPSLRWGCPPPNMGGATPAPSPPAHCGVTRPPIGGGKDGSRFDGGGAQRRDPPNMQGEPLEGGTKVRPPPPNIQEGVPRYGVWGDSAYPWVGGFWGGGAQR